MKNLEGTPEVFNPHARMRELDEQFNDSYCETCKRECEAITACESCGEQPKGIDIDMQYCRYCNDHATFIESCEFCGEEVQSKRS